MICSTDFVLTFRCEEQFYVPNMLKQSKTGPEFNRQSIVIWWLNSRKYRPVWYLLSCIKDNIFLATSCCRLSLRLVYWTQMPIWALFLSTQSIYCSWCKMPATLKYASLPGSVVNSNTLQDCLLPGSGRRPTLQKQGSPGHGRARMLSASPHRAGARFRRRRSRSDAGSSGRPRWDSSLAWT